ERERAVECANDFADADLIGCTPELITAARPLPALDQAPVLQGEQDIFEELLGNGFLLGEIADENGTTPVLARKQNHRLEAVLAFPRQHRKVDKVYKVSRLLSNGSVRPKVPARHVHREC